MAEVVVEQSANQAPQNGGVFGDVGGFFQWLGHYWWIILIVIVLIGAVVFLIWFILYLNKKYKQKDMEYLRWERTVDACNINKRKIWIRKKRRWWIIPVGGIPTAIIFGLSYLYLFLGESWVYFWIFIIFGFLLYLPIVLIFYKDISMRIINVENRTIGYYRGHCKRMDGFIYIYVNIGKKWLLFDNNMLVRLPEKVLTFKTVMTKDKEGNPIKKKEFDTIEIDNYVWNDRDNYIFIPMVSMVLEDTYYYSPTLVDNKGGILDLRQKISESYHLQSGIQILENNYSSVSRLMSDAVDSNVIIQAVKKSPQKQQDNNAGNSQNDNNN